MGAMFRSNAGIIAGAPGAALFRKNAAATVAGAPPPQSDMALYDKGNPDGGAFDPSRKRKGRAATELAGPAPAGTPASKQLLGS